MIPSRSSRTMHRLTDGRCRNEDWQDGGCRRKGQRKGEEPKNSGIHWRIRAFFPSMTEAGNLRKYAEFPIG